MTTKYFYFWFGWLEPAIIQMSLQMIFIAQMAEKAKKFGYEGVVAPSMRARLSFVIEILENGVRLCLRVLDVVWKW